MSEAAAARQCAERMKSDAGFFPRLAVVKDEDERLALIHSEGFNCTWDEVIKAVSPPLSN